MNSELTAAYGKLRTQRERRSNRLATHRSRVEGVFLIDVRARSDQSESTVVRSRSSASNNQGRRLDMADERSSANRETTDSAPSGAADTAANIRSYLKEHEDHAASRVMQIHENESLGSH
jgi:hypothetical protein